MLPDGHYAVPSRSGNYRLLWLKTVTGDLGEKDKGMFGKRILYYKKGRGWCAFAFLNDDSSLKIHSKFLLTWSPEQLVTIRSAVMAIQQDPESAKKLYEELVTVKQ
jgi:hypothetical protein